jgi:dolichol-phosphate mannosyltransferase
MPELTVVVPAFRERENIPSLLAALDNALAGLDWETIVVVDDAFDGSEDVVRLRAQQDFTTASLTWGGASAGKS